MKWYNYISQITRMFDKELHHEYIFCSYLAKLLPGDPTIEFNLDNRVKLEYYHLAKTFEGAIELDDQSGSWAPTNPKRAGAKKEKLSPLDEIIQRINEEFMGEFTDADRVIVEDLYNRMKKDKDVQKAAQTNASRCIIEACSLVSLMRPRWQHTWRISKRIFSFSKMRRNTMQCKPRLQRCCIGTCTEQVENNLVGMQGGKEWLSVWTINFSG